MPRDFALSEESTDDTYVIAVRGEIDMATAPEFSERIAKSTADGPSKVVVDLAETTFIDSTGLSVLLNLLRRLTRRNGRLVIACTNPTVLRLFAVTKMDTTFDIASSRDEALSRLQTA